MSLPEQIDELCDFWAEQWQLQTCPDLRTFLATTDPALVNAVLPVLLPIDVNLRRLRNPQLRSDDYQWLGDDAVAIAENCFSHSVRSETAGVEHCVEERAAQSLWSFRSDSVDSCAHDFEEAAVLELKDLPSEVRNFRVVELIGGGGQGVVAKAVHQGTGQVAAIKFIRPELAASLPVRRRFLRESTIARSIHHRNVVQFLSVEEKPQLCIVMEFVAGGTLESLIREEGTLSVQQIVRLGIQIADGLEAVHQANIVHRDLKPMNILLQAGQLVIAKISDFGVARFAGDPGVTRSGTIVGSAMWLSPEQALERTVTRQSDLFSLGSILYCAACGQSPFQRPTLMATLNAVVEDTEVAVDAIRPDLPQPLVALIQELLRKTAASRPESAAEVATRLRSLMAEPAIVDSPQLMIPTAAPARASRLIGRRALLATLAAITCSAAAKSSRFRAPLVDTSIVQHIAVENVGNGSPGSASSPTSDVPDLLTLPCERSEVQECQTAWSNHLKLPVAFDHPAGIRFLLIPPVRLTTAQQKEIGQDLLQLQNLVNETHSSIRPTLLAGAETSPFFAAVSPINWRQYRTLIDGPLAGNLLTHFGTSGQNHKSETTTADSPAELSWGLMTELMEVFRRQDTKSQKQSVSQYPWPAEWSRFVSLPQPLEWLLIQKAVRCDSSRSPSQNDLRLQVMRTSQNAVSAGLRNALQTTEVPCLFSDSACRRAIIGWIDTQLDHDAQSGGFAGRMFPQMGDNLTAKCSWENAVATDSELQAAIWPIIRVRSGGVAY
jgi:serine/threonine protein kinase